jgi:hypothetical protein
VSPLPGNEIFWPRSAPTSGTEAGVSRSFFSLVRFLKARVEIARN